MTTEHPETSSIPPYLDHVHNLFAQYCVDPSYGRSDSEAKALLESHGPNRLKPPQSPSRLRILVAQVLNAMSLVLISAMAVSFGTQDYIAGGTIFILIAINVVVGYSQEWKAAKVLAALESVSSPVATVLRGGTPINISAENVVVGDILMVKIGDIVAADARVLPEHLGNLECDEALLTGEALPITKTGDKLSEGEHFAVGDRINMLYAGSQVTKGRGRAIVTSTGMLTELGNIVSALSSKATGSQTMTMKMKTFLGLANTTPLQHKLNAMAYILLLLAIVVAFVVVSSTGFKNIPKSIATYAVATAVSLLPTSLVAVVSLTLAVACRELAEGNALVRRMDAVETLGGIHDICSDKTGTITVGRMVVKKAWIPVAKPDNPLDGRSYTVESGSDPYSPVGSIHAEGPPISPVDSEDEHFRSLITCVSLNNMAAIVPPSEDREAKAARWSATGDPTEIALQVFAHKAGCGKPSLLRAGNPDSRLVAGCYQLVIEHPFDSTVKRMSTVWTFHPDDGTQSSGFSIIYMKGATERVLDRCVEIGLKPGQTVPLAEDTRSRILTEMEALAAEGLRVLCFATKYIPDTDMKTVKEWKRDVVEENCIFIGLVGIYDPPRPESCKAVMDAHRAGIVPRMLTGDHVSTAKSIAQSVGILSTTYGASAVTTGPQFDALTDAEIDALPSLPLVVARCAPQTKVRMVDALHRRNRKTVMTGDGVNDSPALKRADVGVAMGLNGSDVAKSAADIVLADDNFSTIVQAIRKGRGVFRNLDKFLVYLLSGNVGQVGAMVVGLAFRKDGVAVYPMAPVTALFILTVTAGPPALALGFEAPEPDIMDISPATFQSIFTKTWLIDTFGYGVLMGAQTLANFIIVLYGVGRGTADIEPWCNDALVGLQDGCRVVFRARGVAFATMQLILLLHAITCKDMARSMFKTNLLNNRFLLWSVTCLSLTIFPALYIPGLNDRIFQVQGLTWEWGLVVGQILLYMIVAELYKSCLRPRIVEKGRGMDGSKMDAVSARPAV